MSGLELSQILDIAHAYTGVCKYPSELWPFWKDEVLLFLGDTVSYSKSRRQGNNNLERLLYIEGIWTYRRRDLKRE